MVIRQGSRRAQAVEPTPVDHPTLPMSAFKSGPRAAPDHVLFIAAAARVGVRNTGPRASRLMRHPDGGVDLASVADVLAKVDEYQWYANKRDNAHYQMALHLNGRERLLGIPGSLFISAEEV